MEPLLAWADRILMKALEVSENFFMSTGLGTLQARTEKVSVPEGLQKQLVQPCPGLKEEAGQREAALACHSASEQQLRPELTLPDTPYSEISMAPELPASLAFFTTHSLHHPLDGPYKLTPFLSPPPPWRQHSTPSLLPH